MTTWRPRVADFPLPRWPAAPKPTLLIGRGRLLLPGSKFTPILNAFRRSRQPKQATGTRVFPTLLPHGARGPGLPNKKPPKTGPLATLRTGPAANEETWVHIHCLDDPLGGRSPVAKLGISLPCPPCALTADRGSAGSLPGMIPEIDIWRVANLMLKRYGDLAEVESARRADELWEDGMPRAWRFGAGLWVQSSSS